MTHPSTRSLIVAGTFLFALLLIFIPWRDPRPPATALGIPTVMRTPGGLLEVATIEAFELFTKKDRLSFLGLNFGETFSEIRAPVTYRYHVELARESPVRTDGKTATVVAPPIKSSVPVAFDTATIEKRTEAGWLRFNKAENLDLLERSMSTVLEKRATSPRCLKLVREDARRTVEEFVTKWLLSEAQWKCEPGYSEREPGYSVVVIFADEPGAANGAQLLAPM